MYLVIVAYKQNRSLLSGFNMARHLLDSGISARSILVVNRIRAAESMADSTENWAKHVIGNVTPVTFHADSQKPPGISQFPLRIHFFSVSTIIREGILQN